MRKPVIGVLLAAMVLPGVAVAQEGDRRPGGERPLDGGHRRDGDRGPQGQSHFRPAPQSQPPAQVRPQGQGGGQPPAAPRVDGHDGASRFGGERPRQVDGAHDRDQGGGPDRRVGGDRRDDRSRFAPGRGGYESGNVPSGAGGGYRAPGGFGGGPGYRPAPPPPAGRGDGWNRGWRGDGRYDWGRYRQQDRYAFRLPRYQAPGGWGFGYRRFSSGFTLAPVLFDEDYWIDDPFLYHLPPAYGPYRWVRYYDDALLVDVRTGAVVDTVYDIFW